MSSSGIPSVEGLSPISTTCPQLRDECRYHDSHCVRVRLSLVPHPHCMSQAAIRPFSQSPSVRDLFDTVTVSSDSQRTTTDTSTVWGPGTLSGRALLALGEVTIRGIDALLIRRRLATIRLRAPALTNSMCDDLLELCRPGMYSLRIQSEALRLSAQICVDSKYSKLVLSLCKWPQQEARMIILELIRHVSGLVHLAVRQLEGFYSFLVAIIQVKEEWRGFMIEAGSLLGGTFHFNLLDTHPIHILCTGTSSDTHVSALSTLQTLYSFDMRSQMWLSLHMSGLPWQDRMLRIEKIIAGALHPELSAPELSDAIADAVIFTRSEFNLELQSSAVSCLRQINGARWKNVCDFFGFPPKGFAAATHPKYALSAAEVEVAELFLQGIISNATNAFDKLFNLCLHIHYPPQITNTAILLALRKICSGSLSLMTGMAISVCRLPTKEMDLAIKTMIEDVPLVLCSLNPAEKTEAIHHFCDFLATVFLINNDYCYSRLSVDIAARFLASSSTVQHPTILICSERVKGARISPFSKIQAMHSKDGRHSIWIALQAAGFSLDSRMTEVIDSMASTKQLRTPLFFDAIADAVIFTSEIFSPELRSSAINCLLDQCVKSKQWELLHQACSFDYRVENLMFTTLRDRLSQYGFCQVIFFLCLTILQG
ncbi:hypothetical protein DFH09DRAFT_266964 [Mycena vulgaris]|nr:hypothetical protein DFH09DRAFT_266964 [Mycena vulgaris]